MIAAAQNKHKILFLAALVLTTLWKLFVDFKLDLCFDESYYWYWSLFPQLSYFDHPPLTAWAMSVSGLIFGATKATVRFWPIISGIAFSLIGRKLARTLYDARTGDTVGALLLLTPAFIVNGFIMTPDTLFQICWALALFFTWRALSAAPGAEIGWWLLAGASAGFGFLSKYNMVLFFFSLGFLFLLVPEWRKRIFLGTVIAGVVALLIFSPVIIWNAQNDWISFRFQLTHGFSGSGHSVLSNVGNYLGGLLLIVTPLLALLCLPISFKAMFSSDKRQLFLSSFFWPTIAFFGYSGLRAQVQANWPALAFFSALILLAAPWPAFPVRLRQAAVFILLAFDVCTMAYIALPREVSISIGGKQLAAKRMREFYSSDQVAAAVITAKQETNAAGIIAKTHQAFGSLAFYAPSERDNLLLPDDTKLRFPWLSRNSWQGKDMILLNFGPWPEEIMPKFKNIQFLKAVPVPARGDEQRQVFLYLGRFYLP